MAEVIAALGVIASVAQLADYGFKLSVKLFTYSEAVYTADESIKSISNDVSLTSIVLQELYQVIKLDESRVVSNGAIEATAQTVRDCLAVFQQLNDALDKIMGSMGLETGNGMKKTNIKKSTMAFERMKWPFKQSKMELMRSNLDRLKANLALMLQVLSYARDVADRRTNESSLLHQKYIIESLARSEKTMKQKYYDLQRAIESQAVPIHQINTAANITAPKGTENVSGAMHISSQPVEGSLPTIKPQTLIAELLLCFQLLNDLLMYRMQIQMEAIQEDEHLSKQHDEILLAVRNGVRLYHDAPQHEKDEAAQNVQLRVRELIRERYLRQRPIQQQHRPGHGTHESSVLDGERNAGGASNLSESTEFGDYSFQPIFAQGQHNMIPMNASSGNQHMFASRYGAQQEHQSIYHSMGDPAGGGTANHRLQDYQMQLMLLKQQNKKRLMMACQEQDSTLSPNNTNPLDFEKPHHQRATPMSAGAATPAQRSQPRSQNHVVPIIEWTGEESTNSVLITATVSGREGCRDDDQVELKQGGTSMDMGATTLKNSTSPSVHNEVPNSSNNFDATSILANEDFNSAVVGDPWFPLFPPEKQLEDFDFGAFDDHFVSGATSPPRGPRVPVPGVRPRRERDPLPCIIVEDPNDEEAMKRARKQLANRRARQRKRERLKQLEDKAAERDHWKNVALENAGNSSRNSGAASDEHIFIKYGYEPRNTSDNMLSFSSRVASSPYHILEPSTEVSLAPIQGPSFSQCGKNSAIPSENYYISRKAQHQMRSAANVKVGRGLARSQVESSRQNYNDVTGNSAADTAPNKQAFDTEVQVDSSEKQDEKDAGEEEDIVAGLLAQWTNLPLQTDKNKPRNEGSNVTGGP